MTPEFPAFYAALMALGKDDVERANALHTSYKSLKRLKQRLPIQIGTLCNAPALLRALADDAESMQKEATP
jgi:hypothetical protein